MRINSARFSKSLCDSEGVMACSAGAGWASKYSKLGAQIEDEEVGLVLPWAVEVRAQPGAAPHHLPELRFRPNRFEEHQIHDLGDVDGGVEHVDRDRDVRFGVGLGELVDQVLAVGDGMGDDLRETPLHSG
jgi:hypothetical protein